MDITGLVAVLGAFGIGPAIVYLRNRHKIEERRLELEARNGRGGGHETKQLVEENKLLRERVENLESIVCSVDFELNQKLAKLIDEQRALGPPAGETAAPAAPARAMGATPGTAATAQVPPGPTPPASSPTPSPAVPSKP